MKHRGQVCPQPGIFGSNSEANRPETVGSVIPKETLGTLSEVKVAQVCGDLMVTQHCEN
jgi:hypothetical protein